MSSSDTVNAPEARRNDHPVEQGNANDRECDMSHADETRDMEIRYTRMEAFILKMADILEADVVMHPLTVLHELSQEAKGLLE